MLIKRLQIPYHWRVLFDSSTNISTTDVQKIIARKTGAGAWRQDLDSLKPLLITERQQDYEKSD
jgi:hypothetical protein